MNARAYILITTELGTAGDIVEALQQIPGVARADIVTGTYDVVAIVEVPTPHAIWREVVAHMHTIPGLKSTLTLVAMS